jgi:hypothetical protein
MCAARIVDGRSPSTTSVSFNGLLAGVVARGRCRPADAPLARRPQAAKRPLGEAVRRFTRDLECTWRRSAALLAPSESYRALASWVRPRLRRSQSPRSRRDSIAAIVPVSRTTSTARKRSLRRCRAVVAPSHAAGAGPRVQGKAGHAVARRLLQHRCSGPSTKLRHRMQHEREAPRRYYHRGDLYVTWSVRPNARRSTKPCHTSAADGAMTPIQRSQVRRTSGDSRGFSRSWTPALGTSEDRGAGQHGPALKRPPTLALALATHARCNTAETRGAPW